MTSTPASALTLDPLTLLTLPPQVMTMRCVRAGETIIKEGDLGDEMYIIDR